MSPAVRNLLRKPSKERHEVVLDAAKQLFFAQGYRGTTIEQIAKRAGYSKRTVYLDYRNKDELFVSVCAEGGNLLLRSLEEVPATALAIEQCLDRYLQIYIQFSRNHRHYFRMFFGEATPSIINNCSEEVQERIAAMERACLMVIVRLAERAMREGLIPEVDPWETAGTFVGTATGIILLSMGGSQTVFTQKGLESLVNKAIWTFWAGLRSMTTGAESIDDGEESNGS